MSDLFDLDEALETLTHDVASRGAGPGAATAIGSARRRRRTTIGAVVAVAALAVGGVTIAQLGSEEPHGAEVVDNAGARALPDPAPLDASSLSEATAGWTTTWSSLTEEPADGEIAGMQCLDGVEESGQFDDEPARFGNLAFQADQGGLGFVALAEFAPGVDVSGFSDDLAAAMTACGVSAGQTTDYAGGASAVHYTVPGGDTAQDVWLVRLDQRAAVLFLGSPDSNADTDTSLRVSDALLAALRDGSQLESGSVSSSGEASAEAGAETYLYPVDVSYDDVRQAAGTWAPEWSADGSGDFFDLPCVGEATSAGSVSSMGSTVGSHGVVTYTAFDSGADEWGLAAMGTVLGSCDKTAWTVHRTEVGGDAAAWASSDAGVVFAVQRGDQLGTVQVRDVSEPPAAVADRILGLIQASVASAEVASDDSGSSDG